MDKIDFLPERIKARRERNRRIITQSWLLSICAALLVLLGFVRQGQINKANAERAMYGSAKANIELQLSKRAVLEKQLADLLIKKRISEQLGSRVNTLAVLSALDRLLPRSMALTSLSLEPVRMHEAIDSIGGINASPRAAVAGGKTRRREIVRVRLVITGLAPTDVDVANFIGQLAACPLFEDVNMGYAKNVVFRGRAAREFEASCHVAK